MFFCYTSPFSVADEMCVRAPVGGALLLQGAPSAAWCQRSAAALPHSVRLPAVRKKVFARRYLGEGLLNNVVFVMASTIITGFISFTFFGLNAIGMEIEDPFGDDDNDLDL